MPKLSLFIIFCSIGCAISVAGSAQSSDEGPHEAALHEFPNQENVWVPPEIHKLQNRKHLDNLIKNSHCYYVMALGGEAQRAPSIITMPNPCGKNSASTTDIINICKGTVRCDNSWQDFYFNAAMCPSRDGYHCPSARNCLLHTYANSYTIGKSTTPDYFTAPGQTIYDQHSDSSKCN